LVYLLGQVRHAFPGYVIGATPGTTAPTTVLDAILAGGANPKTVALVSSKFPSVIFMSEGAREVFKKSLKRTCG
jgi:branched-chain amino acid transport system substrate-binding protein